ncbi:dorsalin-1 [Plakobranchus ocellatus]|uniref:Dorsalin-1 n=1 Tax=Plakobranchus ocellatus TaxID=259542 RepID=A0AAV4BTV9_9GAST|nr:dorsalin-1 [Plakobranchus ocellatus]
MRMETLPTGCMSSHFNIGIDTLNVLLYRYKFGGQFKQMKLRGRGKHPSVEELPLNPVYNKTLPISQATKSDLLELCKKLAIPGRYHARYANLPCPDTS